MRLRRVLRGFVLSCGCLAGSYERYDDQVIDLIDDKALGCSRREHRPGAVVTAQDLATAISGLDSSNWHDDSRA